jgi:hypothetical protein
MNKSRVAIAAAAASLVIVTLAGCASYSHADATSTVNSVIQLTPRGLTDNWGTYGYVNSDLKIVPLSECSQANIFASRLCSTVEGNVTFSYMQSKSGPTFASITVDGTKN